MLNVALTGNAAAGKSTILGWFEEWGATVIDADGLVRQVQEPGSPTLDAIIARFGTEILQPDGGLDRAGMRRRILADPETRAALEAIVHPAVRALRDRLARDARARGDLILVNDIPLLFEALDPSVFDLVVLVDAPEAIRRARLVARGLDPAEADQLLAAQQPAAPKRAKSDVVLDNAGTLDQLKASGWTVWLDLRTRAARQAAGPATRMLAVVTHVENAVWLAGTLARYADAGCVIDLVVGSADHAGGVRDALVGVREIITLGLGADAAAWPAAAVIDALAGTIARLVPSVVIAFGEPSGSGPPDHATVAEWARRAAKSTGRAHPAVFEATACTAAEALVRLDVRPWRDVWRGMAAALWGDQEVRRAGADRTAEEQACYRLEDLAPQYTDLCAAARSVA